MKKTWVYTYLSFDHRSTHMQANGQQVIGMDTPFIVGGYKTVAPQHFGIASEDINCTCNYTMDYLQDVNTSESEYKEYKEAK